MATIMLLQRTCVLFPAPISGGPQPPVTPAQEANALASVGTHRHINVSDFLKNVQSEVWSLTGSPSTWQSKAGGLPRAGCQPRLQSDSLSQKGVGEVVI